MAIFTFVRHGQTQWNLEGRFTGSADIHLTEKGKCDLLELAKTLRPEIYSACYCSPLLRTKETAELLLGESKVEVFFEPRIVELRLGEWEGMLFTDIEKKYSELLSLRARDPLGTPAPGGGEHLGDLWMRVAAALVEIESKHGAEERVLVVSHGVVLSLLRVIQSGGEFPSIWTSNRVPNGFMFDWDSREGSWQYLQKQGQKVEA